MLIAGKDNRHYCVGTIMNHQVKYSCVHNVSLAMFDIRILHGLEEKANAFLWPVEFLRLP